MPKSKSSGADAGLKRLGEIAHNSNIARDVARNRSSKKVQSLPADLARDMPEPDNADIRVLTNAAVDCVDRVDIGAQDPAIASMRIRQQNRDRLEIKNRDDSRELWMAAAGRNPRGKNRTGFDGTSKANLTKKERERQVKAKLRIRRASQVTKARAAVGMPQPMRLGDDGDKLYVSNTLGEPPVQTLHQLNGAIISNQKWMENVISAYDHQKQIVRISKPPNEVCCRPATFFFFLLSGS